MSETTIPLEDFLEHFGVLGMKWGHRKNLDGVSVKTNKEARKDAEEFSRAKMFYGEGAGTRRKLIKATVDAKIAKDPNYKKAFDAHLSRQDMSLHAEKARKERNSTDRSARNKKRAGALARSFTGEMGTQAAFVAVGLIGAKYLSNPANRVKMNKKLVDAEAYVSKLFLANKIKKYLN